MRIAAPSMHRWIDARDIRFWLTLFFLIRLYGITNPPLEATHNWRQTATLMVARNFVESGPDLLHPRVDIAGERSGIVGAEFPLLNLLIHLAALLFGYDHWHGRLIVLVVSTLGAWAFHALVRRHHGDRTALFAALVLTCSLWFSYSRKVMPDVFALSLVLVALFFASRYLDRARMADLLLFAVLGAAGLLSKIPAILPMVALLPMAMRPGVDPRRRGWLAAATTVLLLPAAWWYGYWFGHLTRTYGHLLFSMGMDLRTGAIRLLGCWQQALEIFWFHALRFSGMLVFLAGLFLTWRKKPAGVPQLLLLSAAGMLLFMCKAGDGFCGNTYYVLPFVPMMALVCGVALAGMPSPRWSWVLMAAIMIEGIADQQHDFRLTDAQRVPLTLEPLLHGVVDPRERIAINDPTSPMAMYFAHRKGWMLDDGLLHDPRRLDSLATLGCRFVVIICERERTADMPWPLVAENEWYRVHARAGDQRVAGAGSTGRSPSPK